MSEITEFLYKLEFCECDLIVLTFISDDRLYCRFFKGGLYKDRMFINEPGIISQLRSFSGEGEEIDAVGINRLRHLMASTQSNTPDIP